MNMRFVWLIFLPLFGLAQQQDSLYLGFEEYLEMVKMYHPVVKQAKLLGERGEADLLKARGGFDPKLEAGYNRKDFKDTRYYDLFNSTFKVPTWYGVELKAKFEKNEGVYLNPQNKVPEEGLFAAGISVPVGQGLWINERMAALKKAKAYRQQIRADQQLAVNEILYEASLAYFEWFAKYKELYLYENFIENAERRYNGILKSYRAGDKPAIDTLEANIQIQDRGLSLEQAQLEFFKASMNLGTFLWADENTPLELQEQVYPSPKLGEDIMNSGGLYFEEELAGHPKLRSLEYKLEILEFDKKLKANKLLPKLDLEYNFLSGDPDILRSYVNENYKIGFNFSIPLFLRKERGDLKLSQLKLENAELELMSQELQLRNKIRSLREQFASYLEQVEMINALVDSYTSMLKAEERKLELGESSVFLVNTREKSLISARLKQIAIKQKLWDTRAELKKVLALYEG
ncbi:transporter [Christiangramia salexigens]|uniref:Transporter n=2 Tax=Christiangramia salexigens TaxID=1913577 RepID=A0A1L3J8A8_9FLAO|nr:transporter [Christiangramia salexigens]